MMYPLVRELAADGIPVAMTSRGWDTLLGALVEHEFLRNDRQPPIWTGPLSLSVRADWVLTHAVLDTDEVRRRSPPGLERRVYVAHEDLVDP